MSRPNALLMSHHQSSYLQRSLLDWACCLQISKRSTTWTLSQLPSIVKSILTLQILQERQQRKSWGEAWRRMLRVSQKTKFFRFYSLIAKAQYRHTNTPIRSKWNKTWKRVVMIPVLCTVNTLLSLLNSNRCAKANQLKMSKWKNLKTMAWRLLQNWRKSMSFQLPIKLYSQSHGLMLWSFPTLIASS